MRFGCCGSMISPCTDPIGTEIVEALAELQYDYIELSLSHLTALREPVFRTWSGGSNDQVSGAKLAIIPFHRTFD